MNLDIIFFYDLPRFRLTILIPEITNMKLNNMKLVLVFVVGSSVVLVDGISEEVVVMDVGIDVTSVVETPSNSADTE